MATEQKKAKQKKPPTPRQLEIKRLRDKGRDGRTDQESARLDQLGKEERRERFLRLAGKRVGNARKQLRNVARMANRAVYEYSAEEAQKIIDGVMERVKEMVDSFAAKQKSEDTWTL